MSFLAFHPLNEISKFESWLGMVHPEFVLVSNILLFGIYKVKCVNFPMSFQPEKKETFITIALDSPTKKSHQVHLTSNPEPTPMPGAAPTPEPTPGPSQSGRSRKRPRSVFMEPLPKRDTPVKTHLKQGATPAESTRSRKKLTIASRFELVS